MFISIMEFLFLRSIMPWYLPNTFWYFSNLIITNFSEASVDWALWNENCFALNSVMFYDVLLLKLYLSLTSPSNSPRLPFFHAKLKCYACSWLFSLSIILITNITYVKNHFLSLTGHISTAQCILSRNVDFISYSFFHTAIAIFFLKFHWYIYIFYILPI